MIGENKSIDIEELIQEVREQFEYITEIHVWHKLSWFHITVHTDEAESVEQYIEMPYDRLELDIGKSDPLSVEYNVIATYYGPGDLQGVDGTTIYMSESVRGSRSRDVDEGITRLKQKLAGNCPTCNNEVDDLRGHYRENEDCAEDDRTQRNKFDTLGRPITDESKGQRSLNGNDNTASEKLSNEEIAKIVDTVRHASRQAVKSYKSTLRNDKPFQKMDILSLFEIEESPPSRVRQVWEKYEDDVDIVTSYFEIEQCRVLEKAIVYNKDILEDLKKESLEATSQSAHDIIVDKADTAEECVAEIKLCKK